MTVPIFFYLCALLSNRAVNGFMCPALSTITRHEPVVCTTFALQSYRSMELSLAAAQGKKRRRKRKEAPTSIPTLDSDTQAVEDAPQQSNLEGIVDDSEEDYEEEENEEEEDLVVEPAATETKPMFKFDRNEALALGKLCHQVEKYRIQRDYGEVQCNPTK